MEQERWKITTRQGESAVTFALEDAKTQAVIMTGYIVARQPERVAAFIQHAPVGAAALLFCQKLWKTGDVVERALTDELRADLAAVLRSVGP